MAFSLISALALAGEHPETAYRDAWCSRAKGQAEYRLRDGSRVDCLTANYAVEIEFAPKWKESVGQALHYARLTGEKPAVVLVVERPDDWRHYWHLRKIAEDLDIEVWYIRPEDL